MKWKWNAEARKIKEERKKWEKKEREEEKK